ncbi:putative nuclease HARBI1 [Saccostrea echinata]|uniref:putative nuclease HARBI1 n=1 Tax=Saccostrea echinata TaxID=191078 RepID=UPI002A8072E9|nr:putative nuclease HARBI1 [Saccostrea echinata]
MRIANCKTYNKLLGPEANPIRDSLMFLWYIGSLESFRSMADRFDVGKSPFHLSITRVATTVVDEIMPSVIQWPRVARIQEISNAFGDISGFQNMLGAVDGSHISIKFTYVWTGNPGSTHDASVLRSSELFAQSGELFPQGFYLLGDSAFPLLGWLVTPFKDYGNLTRNQRLFNVCHSKSRPVIERSFGLLKIRFRRLLRLDASDIKLVINSIPSACVLHNICMKMNEENFYQLDMGNDGADNNNVCDRQNPDCYQMSGVRLRNELMQQLMQIN